LASLVAEHSWPTTRPPDTRNGAPNTPRGSGATLRALQWRPPGSDSSTSGWVGPTTRRTTRSRDGPIATVNMRTALGSPRRAASASAPRSSWRLWEPTGRGLDLANLSMRVPRPATCVHAVENGSSDPLADGAPARPPSSVPCTAVRVELPCLPRRRSVPRPHFPRCQLLRWPRLAGTVGTRPGGRTGTMTAGTAQQRRCPRYHRRTR
jgi:hypothetical protein